MHKAEVAEADTRLGELGIVVPGLCGSVFGLPELLSLANSVCTLLASEAQLRPHSAVLSSEG